MRQFILFGSLLVIGTFLVPNFNSKSAEPRENFNLGLIQASFIFVEVENGDLILHAFYEDAPEAEVSGHLFLEFYDEALGVWLPAFDLTGLSTSNSNGDGEVDFNCGPESIYNSGTWRYRVQLTSGTGNTDVVGLLYWPSYDDYDWPWSD